MILLHLPKHSPITHNTVLPPVWAWHLPFSPFVPSQGHLYILATSELLRAALFFFPCKSSSSLEAQLWAHLSWSPIFPECFGRYALSTREWPLCLEAPRPHEGPRWRVCGLSFAQSVWVCGLSFAQSRFWGELLNKAVSALPHLPHLFTNLYY